MDRELESQASVATATEHAADGESQSRRRLASWLLRDITLTVFVVSTVGAFGSWHYLLDLCSHFRWQYLGLLAALAVLLWRIKSPRWAGLALLGAIYNAVLVGPYYLPVSWASHSGTQLSLISFNVHASNRNSDEVLAYLQRKDPDLILLIEVDQRWLRELSPLKKDYPYQMSGSNDGPFGIAFYSKRPILNHELLSTGGSSSQSIWAEMEIDGRRFGFLGAHPPPPMTPHWFHARNEILVSLADKVKSSGLPTILAGDFNATPWCCGFRPLTAAGLRDTALGFGVQPTWNSKIPLMWIPIDHVLTTPEFTCLRRSVGPNCGSDHYAVEAELRLR